MAWTSLRCAWSTYQERVLQRSVIHSIEIGSCSGLQFFAANLEANCMVEIHQYCLPPSAKIAVEGPGNYWIVQEDNDLKMCSRLWSVNYEETQTHQDFEAVMSTDLAVIACVTKITYRNCCCCYAATLLGILRNNGSRILY